MIKNMVISMSGYVQNVGDLMEYWEGDLYDDLIDRIMKGNELARARLLGLMVGEYCNALKDSGLEGILLEDLASDYQWNLIREVEGE